MSDFDATVIEHDRLRKLEKTFCTMDRCAEACTGPTGYCWVEKKDDNRKVWNELLRHCNPQEHNKGNDWIKTQVPCSTISPKCDLAHCTEGTNECGQDDRPSRKDEPTKTNFYGAKGSCWIEKKPGYGDAFWKLLKQDCAYPNERPGHENRPYGEILEERGSRIKTNTPCWEGTLELKSDGTPLDK